MCGCGVARYCPGGCACGCDHDTFEGRTRQAEFFATQAEFQHEWASRAVAALDRVRSLANCTTCGWKHEPWQRRRGEALTWAHPEDGHPYRPRLNLDAQATVSAAIEGESSDA